MGGTIGCCVTPVADSELRAVALLRLQAVSQGSERAIQYVDARCLAGWLPGWLAGWLGALDCLSVCLSVCLSIESVCLRARMRRLLLVHGGLGAGRAPQLIYSATRLWSRSQISLTRRTHWRWSIQHTGSGARGRALCHRPASRLLLCSHLWGCDDSSTSWLQ